MTLAAHPSSSPTHATVSRSIVAEAAERAVALGIADRAHDGSITFVQRAESDGAGTPAPAAAQPSTTQESTPEPDAPRTTIEAPTGGPAAAPAAARADLDELARQLYERIRWRLRAELRLDMERSGRSAVSRR
jgi:hypothetical protein